MPLTQPNGFSEIRIHQFMFGPNLPADGLRFEDRVLKLAQKQRNQFGYLLATSPLEALNGVRDTTKLFEPPVESVIEPAELSDRDVAFMESLNSPASKVRSALRAFFS